MSALGLFAKGVSKAISSSAARKAKRNPAPALAPAVFNKVDKAVSEFFTVGFAKTEIMPKDISAEKYWVAGYRTNNRAQGVLDPMMAHAVWIDDHSGKGGIVLVSVDCVGLMNGDVLKIRETLADFQKETGCRSINIISTHTHAGIDTMGLWGPLPRSGRNKEFINILYAGVKEAVEKAYADRREGSLFVGTTVVKDIQKDSRLPHVYSDTLTRVRFVPNDGSREVYMVNFGAHPESLTGKNSLVSADVPRYMGDEIMAETGAELIYFSGAIGGLIAFKPLSEDNVESTKIAAHRMAQSAMSIDNERKLSPKISLIRQEFYFDADNPILTTAAIVKILHAKRYATGSGSLNTSMKSELTYIEIDTLKLLLVPGEIFPELAYGGYLSAEESATGKGPEVNPKPLIEIAEDDSLVIIGLANDEIGYMVPPNDFFVSPKIPYIDKAKDHMGRNHYEETNSLGPNTAVKLAEVFTDMMKKVKAASTEI